MHCGTELQRPKKTASTSTPNVVEIESNESNMQLALVPLPAQNDDEENVKAPQPDKGPPTPIVEETATNEEGEMSKMRVDLEVLEHDPGKGSGFSSRGMMSGPYQPNNHDFKYRDIGGHPRRFCPFWFKENK